MKNYIIVTVNDMHIVKETQTSYVIKKFKSIKNAKTYCNKLNKGLGFDGQTPNFMFQRFAIK
jgi:hypothetical protein